MQVEVIPSVDIPAGKNTDGDGDYNAADVYRFGPGTHRLVFVGQETDPTPDKGWDE